MNEKIQGLDETIKYVNEARLQDVDQVQQKYKTFANLSQLHAVEERLKGFASIAKLREFEDRCRPLLFKAEKTLEDCSKEQEQIR